MLVYGRALKFSFCFRGDQIQRQVSAVKCYRITLDSAGKDKTGEK